MGPRQCQVCNKTQSKYKCPSCYTPYCSLACFKKHKEIPCVKPTPSELKTNSTGTVYSSTTIAESHVQKPIVADDPSEVLQKSQLDAIASSTKIRSALKDKALQELICSIDCSPDAENVLDKAMAEEPIRLFMEEILSVMNP